MAAPPARSRPRAALAVRRIRTPPWPPPWPCLRPCVRTSPWPPPAHLRAGLAFVVRLGRASARASRARPPPARRSTALPEERRAAVAGCSCPMRHQGRRNWSGCWRATCAGERRKGRGKKKKAGAKMTFRRSSLTSKVRNEYFNRRSVRQQILQKTECLSANLIIFSVRQLREVIFGVPWPIRPSF